MLRPSLTVVPEGWTGSLPEWQFYASLVELGYEPNEDFTYQSPLMGGRLDKGGLVIDFLFNNPPNLAVNVQGVYYHYELGADTRARDIFARESLAGQGITLIFVDEDYLAQDPLGTTREALQFRDSSRLGRS
jgi:hypothetical protein|tara:strand:- start:886 stop:1281 length:396 start_codon:yes stop_codon:yes gene_type:complete